MKWLGIAVVVIFGGFILYNISYPTYSYRYRMTVNVEVDGQIARVQASLRFEVSKQLMFLPSVNPLAYAVRGEAVYLALGEHGGSCAFRRRGVCPGSRLPSPVVVSGLHFKLNLFDDRKLASLPALRGKWELPANEPATLVAVPDPNNSATLRVIRPEQFVQTFGPNVHWRGIIIIEMTSDPITRGLESRLPLLVSQSASLRGANQNPRKFIPIYEAFIQELTMSVSDDLFLAILSMDAYNRGYDRHVNVTGTQIGGATLGEARPDIAQSFFAQSTTGAVKRLSRIANDNCTDVLNGWITGAGIYGAQVELAASFYQSIAGQSIWDGPASNVVLTGHSLGGRLAGLIASLTGDRATVFDNMPYAAQRH